MERKHQLSNVAFGGAWSEQIAGREALSKALECLLEAAERTAEENLTDDQRLAEALSLCCAAHPRGPMLQASWLKALSLSHPSLRARELTRIATALQNAYSAQTKR